ncbi:MAG: DUF1080 domain-containing protein [Planctomycetaceae bacterium]|nr:DUF1080 domain-containing protein [Planctomycetaceae bacterium]
MNRFLLAIPVLASLVLSASAVQAQPYQNLLQDKSLALWMKQDGGDVESGWEFTPDGLLHLAGKGGNLLTREEFGDFDLWFEWKIAEKGNNGIKYRVKQYGNQWLGLEYQIQHDEAFPKMANKHQTASLYDIFEPSQPIFERRYLPLEEFSTSRIIVQNGRIRHWMNGKLIIDEQVGTERWKNAVANSKFKNHEAFGENHNGRLMLTDHGTEVWYRNVFIRSLDGCALLP